MDARTLALGLATLLAAAPAPAQDPPPAARALFACRTIADPAARLACFDREAAALDTATREKSVVVLDREEVRRTRRSLFGFTLPSLKLFGGGGKQTRDANDEMARIDATVRTVGRGAEGIRFTIDDGAAWVQTDDRVLMLGRIRPGTAVRIERASMGSFFATFPGQPGVRVRRER